MSNQSIAKQSRYLHLSLLGGQGLSFGVYGTWSERWRRRTACVSLMPPICAMQAASCGSSPSFCSAPLTDAAAEIALLGEEGGLAPFMRALQVAMKSHLVHVLRWSIALTLEHFGQRS